MAIVRPVVGPILIRDTYSCPDAHNSEVILKGFKELHHVFPLKIKQCDHFDAFLPLTGSTFALNAKARWNLGSIHKLHFTKTRFMGWANLGFGMDAELQEEMCTAYTVESADDFSRNACLICGIKFSCSSYRISTVSVREMLDSVKLKTVMNLPILLSLNWFRGIWGKTAPLYSIRRNNRE